jgi:diguanylate cyclase (GGDEF)-like protein/PAS domain S-box-containing protein
LVKSLALSLAIVAPIAGVWAVAQYDAQVEASIAAGATLLDLHGVTSELQALQQDVEMHGPAPNLLDRLRTARRRFVQLNSSLDSRRPERSVVAVSGAYQGYVEAMDNVILSVSSGQDATAASAAAATRLATLEAVLFDAQRAVATTLAEEQRRAQSRALGLVSAAALCSILVLVVIRRRGEQTRSEEAARDAAESSERRFRALTEQSSDIVFTTDSEGTITYASASAERILGRPVGSLPGMRLAALVNGDEAAAMNAFLERLSQDAVATHQIECRVARPTGTMASLEIVGRNLTGDAHVRSFVLNARDVTERNRVADELRHEALHDRLTGLPNRTLLLERIRATLAATRAGQAPEFAIAYLDLDGFKAVNDNFGHAAGDQLLRLVSDRLTGVLRVPGKSLRTAVPVSGPVRRPAADTLARFGGDEFVVLLNHIEHAGGAIRAAERMQEALRKPFAVGTLEVRIDASIGLCLANSVGEAPEDLIRHADIAMYRAKSTGRHQPQLFDQELHAALTARLTLESELREAVTQEAFELRFEPIVSAEALRFVGFEATLHWRHPQRGLLPPPAFLPAAESARLNLPIGRWTLREACHQVARWRQRHPSLPSGILHIRLSGAELQQPDALDHLRRVLGETGIRGDALRLHIDETAATHDPEATQTFCRAVKAEGVSIGISDYGTGYGSLAFLRRLDIDFLQVNDSLVREARADTQPTLLSATVGLARALRLGVIFRGVQDTEQLALLSQFEGASLQGPLLAGSLSEHDSWQWLDGLDDGAIPEYSGLWKFHHDSPLGPETPA